MRRVVPAALAVTASLLIAGCGGETTSGGTVTPLAPSGSVTAPTPDASASEAALYAEAERVFREIEKIDKAYMYQGKYEPFPAEYEKWAADEFLATSRALYREAAERNITWENADLISTKVRPLKGVSRDNSEGALRVCLDASQSSFMTPDGTRKQGLMARDIYYFKHVGGNLKFFASDSEEEPCDF